MQATQLTHFLQEDLFLLKADKPLYQNAQPQADITEQAPEPATPQASIAATVPTIPAPATISTTPAITTPVTPVTTFNYLGGNQKKFLVLVHYPTADFMVAEHLTALTGTLGRINFTQNDVAIVNMAKTEAKEWTSMSNFFSPQKLLILGTKAMPAAIPGLNMNAIQNAGNIPALYTFGFDEMMDNNDNKRIFWNLIKTF